MPLPPGCRVKSCMGCIPLQRGCIILGCSGMVLAMLEIGKHVQWLVDFELSVNQCRRKEISNDVSLDSDEDEDSDEDGISQFVPKNLKNPDDKCPSKNLVSLVRFILGFAAFTYAIYFMMTIMMVYGVVKKRPKMMTPWMVWVVAQLFFDLLSLLGLGHGGTPFSSWSLIDIILNVYIILIVTSYYLELKEAEQRRLGVTVLAVSHTPNEMMVVIPTGPKDDLPPPYPGFTSGYNPAYNPTGAGYPTYNPTYNLTYNPNSAGLPAYSAVHNVTLSTPDHQPNIYPQVNQAGHVPIPGSPALYANLNTPNFPNGSGEAAPLVEKPPLPNN